MSDRDYSVVRYMNLDIDDYPNLFLSDKKYLVFQRKYHDVLQKYPFQEAYIGAENPFTNHVIKCENDYNSFLRETVYINMTADMEKKLSEAKNNEALARQDAVSARESKKAARLDATACRNAMNKATSEKDRMAKKRGRIVAALVLLMLALGAVGFLIGRSLGSNTLEERSISVLPTEASGNGYEKGYEAGKVQGFDAGYMAGYRDGYSTGTEDGHEEGFSKGLEEGKKSASSKNRSNSSASGSNRDTPIANSYIGNVNNK